MTTPIYRHKLTAGAYQLHWWMIAKMDEKGEIHGGWRTLAEQDIKISRTYVYKCAKELVKAKLIEARPSERYARVLVSNIVG